MNSTLKSPRKATSIAERVIAYINAVPPAVSGNDGHGQTFKLAMRLVHGFCLGGEALHYLENHYNPRCDPPWSRRELEHKVNSAINTEPDFPRGVNLDEDERKQARPKRFQSKTVSAPPIDALANTKRYLGNFRCTESDLVANSPIKIPLFNRESNHQAIALLKALFEEDDLVNIVTDSKQNEKGKWHPIGYGITLSQPEWVRRLLKPPNVRSEGAWYRFNPMGGEGIADANVTAFRYALIEIDSIPLDLQISLLAKTPLPIAAITCTGVRGYHALAKIDAQSLEEYKATVQGIYERMKLLGVDPKNGNPSRMSRLPGAMRGNKKQRLCYLNPEPSTRGIL